MKPTCLAKRPVVELRARRSSARASRRPRSQAKTHLGPNKVVVRRPRDAVCGEEAVDGSLALPRQEGVPVIAEARARAAERGVDRVVARPVGDVERVAAVRALLQTVVERLEALEEEGGGRIERDVHGRRGSEQVERVRGVRTREALSMAQATSESRQRAKRSSAQRSTTTVSLVAGRGSAPNDRLSVRLLHSCRRQDGRRPRRCRAIALL